MSTKQQFTTQLSFVDKHMLFYLYSTSFGLAVPTSFCGSVDEILLICENRPRTRPVLGDDYRAKRVFRVVLQRSPGARMAAAGFFSQSVLPVSGLGRLCQGSMQTNFGVPGLLQIRV